MPSLKKLEFTDTAPVVADVTIDESVRDRTELLSRIATGLSFPDYFGHNWDALLDCLSDLRWWESAEAVIDHTALPQLSTDELKLYLECLIDAAHCRPPEMLPRLRILFRAQDCETVMEALAPG